MGSPFATHTVNRVHVVRTPLGFDRLSKEILSKTDSGELRPVTVEAMEQLKLAEVWELIPYNFGGTKEELAAKIRSGVERRLWDICHDLDIWTPFTQAYIELCMTCVLAATLRGRYVCTIGGTYLSHDVDCAIVLDFTKKGNLK